ncbi:hypothetical protein [Nocardia vinacea]|uniref:hypothetical protein n=1 Tax=Nocardia vinacea TaxID=96468 RepID=UPI00030150A2|nr:hypothetical protein [Nocardia vinacea]
MTDPSHAAAPSATAIPISDRWAELRTAAIDALTEAVQYAPGGEPIDFGEFLASVLETVAANVGSVARLVAGGSRSSEAVWIHGLAGGESATVEWLAPGRTVPVVVSLNIWDLLRRNGIEEPNGPLAETLRRYRRYTAAFEAAVLAESARLGLTVPVTVQISTDPVMAPRAAADAIAARLWDYAIEATPVALLTEDGPAGD